LRARQPPRRRLIFDEEGIAGQFLGLPDRLDRANSVTPSGFVKLEGAIQESRGAAWACGACGAG
jgi:hypothetical protein